MFNEYIRAIIGGTLTLYIATLSMLLIFHKIPQENLQLANNIIVFLLGMLSTMVGYYFSGNPNGTQKKANITVGENATEINPVVTMVAQKEDSKEEPKITE